MAALYGFSYSQDALSFLETLPAKRRQQIMKKADALLINPFPSGHKIIRGTGEDAERIYRIRSGDYRVLYAVRNNPQHIVVLDIGHRKDVYR